MKKDNIWDKEALLNAGIVEVIKRAQKRPTGMVEYRTSDLDGEFFLDIFVDRSFYNRLVFQSAIERQRAYEDLVSMMRESGAIDLSPRPQ